LPLAKTDVFMHKNISHLPWQIKINVSLFLLSRLQSLMFYKELLYLTKKVCKF